MQVLHAVTSPGDRIVMTSPTFDGYPIFAQMARLESVTVALDAHGHHDLDAMAEAAARPGSWWCAGRTTRPAPSSPPPTSSGSCSGCPRTPWCCWTRPMSSSCHRNTGSTRPHSSSGIPNVVVVRTFSKAYGLAGLRIGYGFCAPDLARRLWTMQLPFGIGITSLVAVAASYDAESQLQQRIRMIASERRYLRMRLRSMGVYSTDGHAELRLPAAAGRPWREVFDGTGLQVRHYADGSVRITVGNRQSTRAVLSAVAPFAMR